MRKREGGDVWIEEELERIEEKEQEKNGGKEERLVVFMITACCFWLFY